MSRNKIRKEIEKRAKKYPALQKIVRDTYSVVGNKSGLKQVIIVRKDLKLPAGKMAAQVAHASVEAAFKSELMVVKKWRQNGAKKVVLKVDTVEGIYECARKAEDEGLVTSIITDAGKTVIAPGTVTCCAIGPAEEKVVDKVTGTLKMY